MARTNRPRSRLLAATLTLGVSVGLLAALPSVPTASAADPTTPFPGGEFTAVDAPAFPASFVADSGGGHYSALTEAGTTVLEYDEDPMAPPVAQADRPALYEMWADDEPYPTAGADATGAGDKHGLDQARFLAAGDIDGAVDWTGPSGVELAWISGEGASTTLSLSHTQAGGFTFRTSTPIEENPIGMTILEKDPGTTDLGAVLVAYPGKIVAHVMDGSTLRQGVTMQLPAGVNGTILDMYHKPVHEGHPGDTRTAPRLFAIALLANGTVQVVFLAANLSAAGASAVIPISQVTQAPAGDWTEADVVYDHTTGLTDVVAMLSVRGKRAGSAQDTNEVVLSQGPGPGTGDCAGTELAAIDIEAVGSEVVWVCSVVGRGVASPCSGRCWVGASSPSRR